MQTLVKRPLETPETPVTLVSPELFTLQHVESGVKVLSGSKIPTMRSQYVSFRMRHECEFQHV